MSPSSPSEISCHCSSSQTFSSPCADSTASGSESVGSSASSSVSYSASTGAAVSFSRSVAATGVGAGWFLVLLLVAGGLGGVAFGAAAAAVADGEGLGLATLTGLPTCAFHGTLACGGVTAGGPTGAAAA